MKGAVELPIREPVYSTYHSQGNGGAVLAENPSILNWYLNQVMILNCTPKFLHGLTTPEVSVDESTDGENPYLEKKYFMMQSHGKEIHSIIQALLEEGYYVAFTGIDDYYVEGKSWYHKRHMAHDGLICGYSQKQKTYSLFAYDQSWIYRVFQTSQKGFEEGRQAAFQEGNYGMICGLKVKPDIIELQPGQICAQLRAYLDSSLERYPLDGNVIIYGTAVHDYVALYLDKLAEESVPYERMDWRVFRMLWEHKKVMLKRLLTVEDSLCLSREISTQYKALVKAADHMRMLYASHYFKRRDSVLPVIRSQLLDLKTLESKLLKEFILKTEGELYK